MTILGAARWLGGLAGAAIAIAGCTANPTPRCAAASDCAHGDTCYRGYCIAQVPPDAATCPAGATRCETCVYLDWDGANCGRCDHVCGDHHVCTSGACVEDR